MSVQGARKSFTTIGSFIYQLKINFCYFCLFFVDIFSVIKHGQNIQDLKSCIKKVYSV